MTFGRLWLAVLLLALPACFDPIVGSKCADGYSPCGNRCVVAGTCTVDDAAAPVDGEMPVDTTAVDVEAIDADESPGEDAAVADDGGVDAGQPLPEVGAVLDVSLKDVPADIVLLSDTADVALTSDVPLVDDVPPVDDLPIGPPILDDAAVDEGALDQATVDEGLDSSDDGGAIVLDAESSETSPAIDADQDAEGTGIDGPLVCTDPSIVCNDTCVDPTTDPDNCGGCNTVCSTNACCNRQCIDLFVDPDNCGGCGIGCGSGLCSNGVCEAAGTGRIIVIGHDYFRNRLSMNRILGNAVFLWPVNPVHVLVYETAANATAIAGADTAIAQVAAATGRQWVRTSAAAADVPAALAIPSAYDVFVIYGQESADDNTLTQLGTAWRSALLDFVNNGGTVVVLDAVYANAGTAQIVSQPGLFRIARDVSATGEHCAVVTRGDALASGLPQTYLCEPNSATFNVTDPAIASITSVVEVSGQSVVVHKVF